MSRGQRGSSERKPAPLCAVVLLGRVREERRRVEFVLLDRHAAADMQPVLVEHVGDAIYGRHGQRCTMSTACIGPCRPQVRSGSCAGSSTTSQIEPPLRRAAGPAMHRSAYRASDGVGDGRPRMAKRSRVVAWMFLMIDEVDGVAALKLRVVAVGGDDERRALRQEQRRKFVQARRRRSLNQSARRARTGQCVAAASAADAAAAAPRRGRRCHRRRAAPASAARPVAASSRVCRRARVT